MNRFLFALLIAAHACAGAAELEIVDYAAKSPAPGYTVRIGVFSRRGSAPALKNELEAKNYSPIAIASEIDRQAVYFGWFKNYPEAWIQRNAFRDEGYEVIVSSTANIPLDWSHLGKEKIAGPAKSIFGLTSGTLLSSKQRNLSGNANYDRLEPLDTPGNEDQYKAELDRALLTCGPQDPVKGYILANLGTLALKKGDMAQAQTLFGQVAKGKVPSPVNVRLMAMRRFAWVTHQLGDRLTAYAAYGELEQQTNADSILATCQVEKQGLLLELAESGKGNHEDVRRSLSETWNWLPDRFTTHKSTLELMFLETFARQPQPDFRKAATMCEEFVVRWNTADENKPIREISSAMHMAGMFWRKGGNDDKALYWAERVLNEVPTTGTKFRGVTPHAQALMGMAYLLRGPENQARNEQIRRNLIEWYPNDNLTTKIKAADPGIMDRVRPSLSNQ